MRYYLAVKQLMVKENARAICSAACMGNPRACLTFSKLNDIGFVGACEGDIDSTLTMLVVPGTITETGVSPLACRTQFTQTVRNARHLFLNWGAGAIVAPDSPGDLSQYAGAMPVLHRAVFYGDHVKGVKRLGELMSFRVVEEDAAS